MDGISIMKLWALGAKVLQLKLGAGGGVHHFSSRRLVKWPHLVSHFVKLRHLNLDVSINVELRLFRSSSILSLPRELETLKICASNAEAGFTMRPMSAHRAASAMVPNSTILSVKAVLPGLKELVVHSKSLLDYEYFFEGLPDSLRKLDLHYASKVLDPALKKLPVNLEVLNLACTTRLSIKGICLLPSGLKSLDLWDASSIGSKLFEHLPRQLTFLNIANFEFLKDIDLPKLPQTLTTLRANRDVGLTWQSTRLLPRSLTELQQSSNSTPNAQSLLDLPPHITHLAWNRAQNVTAQSLASLPQKCITLILDRFTDIISPADAVQLPPTLEHLSWESHTSLNDETLEKLPKGLTWLHLPANDTLSGTSTFDLPRGLTYLDLTSNKNINHDVEISGLPQTLITLRLGATSLTDAAAPLLPRSITILALPNNTTWTNDALAQLPNGLINLDLSLNPNLTDPAIALLPHSLTILRMKSANLTVKCAPHIPPKLVIFDIKNYMLSAWYYSQRKDKTPKPMPTPIV
jgi:hypothetical protein